MNEKDIKKLLIDHIESKKKLKGKIKKWDEPLTDLEKLNIDNSIKKTLKMMERVDKEDE